jgi:hypothetical protein
MAGAGERNKIKRYLEALKNWSNTSGRRICLFSAAQTTMQLRGNLWYNPGVSDKIVTNGELIQAVFYLYFAL